MLYTVYEKKCDYYIHIYFNQNISYTYSRFFNEKKITVKSFQIKGFCKVRVFAALIKVNGDNQES